MSADNGYILRQNTAGEYVVQMYFASADEYPSVDEPNIPTFKTIEKAINWYEEQDLYSEYGLTVKTRKITRSDPDDKGEAAWLSLS